MSLITNLQFLQALASQLLERLSAWGLSLYQKLAAVKRKGKQERKSSTQREVGSKTGKEKASNPGKSHIGDERKNEKTIINIHEEGDGDVFITQKTDSRISYSKAEKQDLLKKEGGK